LSTSDPTVNDDVGDGYLPGDTWINTDTGETFVLVDNTLGAAVWVSTSSAGGGTVSFGSNTNDVSSVGTMGASASNTRADHVHRGVHAITAAGSNAVYGDVNLQSGQGIAISTAAQSITIAATGSGGGVTDHGGLTGLTDDDHTQYVRKTLGGKEVISTVAAAGATETLDLAGGNVHDITLDADCTFNFTGATASVACSFTLVLRQDGTGGWTTTWPASIVWAGGTAPVLDTTLSTVSVLTFFTLDGGTVWYGFSTGGGSAGTAATTVTSETTLSIAAAVGADTEYARQDHTHGTLTPAVISAAGFVGELLVADGTFGPSVNHSEYVEMTTQRTTTSASLEDITGVTADIEIQQTAHIAVWMTCHVSASAVCDLDLAINFDGTDEDVTTTHLTTTDEGNVTLVHRTSTEMPPGTYTVKGRFARSSGGGTPEVDRADFLVMSMGASGPVMLLTEDQTDYIYADIGA
ncbi:MAG TPA: hypothetical protein VMW94_09965, partial [Actinomycetes bacterium]|nr:hypothetical protein [Actinomycetes bacterium]